MTAQSLTLVSPKNDDDLHVFGEILAESLQFPPLEEFDWATRIGRDNIVLANMGQDMAGGAMLVPMGQYFGGRSVPMVGIHGVAVSPEFRGTGVATSLMAGLVRRFHEQGMALSCLYPATQPVYRSAGYEQAGDRIRYRFPTSAFAGHSRGLSMRKYDATHFERVSSLYHMQAANRAGNVDRTSWNWERIISPRVGTGRGYLFEGGGQLQGYVFFTHGDAGQFPYYCIDVLDMMAASPGAALRLFSFLADHRSMAKSITWYGPPADPIALQMHEQCEETVFRLRWMLRLIDMEKALSARGYPRSITGELHLEIDDDLIDANAGRWRLRVQNGRGEISRGGDGRIKTDIRGLAPLYSGFLNARQLKAAGMLDGEDDQLQLAGEVFAGPSPWMADMF